MKPVPAAPPSIEEARANFHQGNLLKSQGKHADAADCYRRAIALFPEFAEAYANLGVVHLLQGNLKQAIADLRQAVIYKPDLAEAHSDLGAAWQAQGNLEEAIACGRRAVALRPDFMIAHYNLGCNLRDAGQLVDAVDSLKRAITLSPRFALAYNDLGVTYDSLGMLDDAIVCYRNALALQPGFSNAYNNLGLVYQRQNNPAKALACHRKALALDPDSSTAHSNVLLCMQYLASCSPEAIFQEHLRFAERFEAPLKASWPALHDRNNAPRRLKIGYVSPDFRRHSVAYFIEPVLAHHDKAQVEVYCYFNHTHVDPVTMRLQRLADHWVPCKHLSDEQLAERIRADGIDILVDLAGHTGGNRLLTFARKPAPVQITYLGHPATTGLTAIDYRLTDAYAEPVGMTEALNVEQLWRLPDLFCCYRAHDNSPDVIDHPPALDNGFVTFGCFNNFSKVTDPVLALWAQILQRVPTARLMLEIAGLDDPVFRAEIESRLVDAGLPLERMLLVPRCPQNQYVLYNQIDIALDPFPCNGGTTSLDTLWMGVPLITLAGRHFTSRMGVTILSNAGLTELIAEDEEQYVDIAVTLATSIPRLTVMRDGLRQRVQASPLMDAPRFTRNLEAAYRGMWEAWHTKHSVSDITALYQRGVALQCQHRPHEALACYERVLALNPNVAEVHNNIAILFADHGRFDEAISHYRQAIALSPQFAEACNNLANALKKQGKFKEAEEHYRRAIASKPDLAQAHTNLGVLLKDQGKLDEAFNCYRQALAHHPEHADTYHSMLLTMQYADNHKPEDVFAAHVAYAERFEAPLRPHWKKHENRPDADKRLKIGYVSADFCSHVIPNFMEPVLAHHDKAQVEVYCYYNQSRVDPITLRLQKLAKHWISCAHLSDAELAERIRTDGIDILIDLSGHTEGTRLQTFAHKPAPVQVSYLGYVDTTGLRSMDYRLTDAWADPPGKTDSQHVEQLWRLPDSLLCYRPHDDRIAIPNQPPAKDKGFVTFGCLNNFSKLTDSVLALWAKILGRLPNAHLMLAIAGIEDAAFRQSVEARFARLDIPLERCVLVPRQGYREYMQSYCQIDLALDPFPFNGGTTSLDSLWMGVPFVTLAGRRFVSRMGVSILSNAGLSELIANSEDEYVDIAVALASDLARLTTLRNGLRERLRASPLMNAPRFVHNLEFAYREMWKRWCRDNTTKASTR